MAHTITIDEAGKIEDWNTMSWNDIKTSWRGVDEIVAAIELEVYKDGDFEFVGWEFYGDNKACDSLQNTEIVGWYKTMMQDSLQNEV